MVAVTAARAAAAADTVTRAAAAADTSKAAGKSGSKREDKAAGPGAVALVEGKVVEVAIQSVRRKLKL